MFKRKLNALEYERTDDFDINDDMKLRNLIVWIQSNKLSPSSTINNENSLKSSMKPDEWNKSFNHFLELHGCNVDPKDKHQCLEWLLSYVIRLQYIGDVNTETPCKKSKSNEDILCNYESEEFKENIHKLASSLHLQTHHNTLQMLKALTRLSTFKKNNHISMQDSFSKSIDLKTFDLGFDTSDAITKNAAKILRLLYINDLRETQDKANQAIVKVQAITANPKTDSKLGKVGR